MPSLATDENMKREPHGEGVTVRDRGDSEHTRCDNKPPEVSVGRHLTQPL